ncbi:MAG: CCA tRNA nucleotidyltransferase [Bdellovibrionaceae bacterium]|nr:CCA tRNA nucleotidyltransferase [Pseudobdellovibrionaceae bacterium]MDW8190042.1 CCA tRNA nucleotidyltransferase [Pseudobdellovibrionaceae bacterium]
MSLSLIRHERKDLIHFFQNQALLQVLRTYRENGYQAYVVGGAVRDAVCGVFPKDFDVVTDAPLEKTQELFKLVRQVGSGARFGIVMVIVEGKSFEVARFRREWGYEDGRHPTHVEFGDLESDFQRRDFTVNALYFDPIDGVLIDPAEGVKDIQRKVIRTVGEPSQRFLEDHLRMLRALRFVSQLGFSLDGDTKEAIDRYVSLVCRVSLERIWNELERLFEGKYFGSTLVATEYGLLIKFFNEWFKGVEFALKCDRAPLVRKPREPWLLFALRNWVSWVRVEGSMEKLFLVVIKKCIRRDCKKKVKDFAWGYQKENWRNLERGVILRHSVNLWVREGMRFHVGEGGELSQYWKEWEEEGGPPSPLVRGSDLLKLQGVSPRQLSWLVAKAYECQLEYRIKEKGALLELVPFSVGDFNRKKI